MSVFLVYVSNYSIQLIPGMIFRDILNQILLCYQTFTLTTTFNEEFIVMNFPYLYRYHRPLFGISKKSITPFKFFHYLFHVCDFLTVFTVDHICQPPTFRLLYNFQPLQPVSSVWKCHWR